MGKFVAKAQFSLKGGVRCAHIGSCIEIRKYNLLLLLRRNEESVNDFYGVIFNNGRTYLPAAESLSQ